MKLLFVDDEARILSGIENALLFEDGDWDAEFSNSGSDAIERMNKADYDVLITDMQMPGLTGADVLEHATTQTPDMIRMVLSGEVNEELAQRAMPLAHEFVSKPCEPEKLFQIITRVFGSSRSLTAESGSNVLGILDRLPSRPDLFDEVQAAVDNGASIDAIAHVIESDLSMTASIIRTANSSFYGFPVPVERVHDAVARLGTKMLSGLMTRAELTAWATPEVSRVVTRINDHATIMSHLVGLLVDEDVSEATQAGRFCNVGMLALVTLFPDRTEAIEELMSDAGLAGDEEKALFGSTHSEVGAAMLEMWNSAPTVVEAVRFHHRSFEATEPVRPIIEAITALNLAARMFDGNDVAIPAGFDETLLCRAVTLWKQAEVG